MITTTKDAELPFFDRAALALLFFFLLTEVLGGAIRYYAVQSGLVWLPYLAHLLLAMAIGPMFFIYLLSEGVTSTYLTILLLFSVGTAYGIYNLNSVSQVEFGLWVLVTFLYGIVVLSAIMRAWRRLIPCAFLLWAVAVAGVLINFFHDWPWVGLEYQVGATAIEASRLWQVAGLNFARLPGFSRASYEAAFQILVLAVFLRETVSKRLWVMVWIFSGIAIALTTSKTALLVFVLFSFMRLSYRGSIRPFWRATPAASASFDILLPLFMLFIRLDWLDSIESQFWVGAIASFAERMQTGWPVWLRMIVERGSPFFGRGLGGIGAAQFYFEPALYSPADNIAVYLFGTFGVLGIILLCVYAWKATRMRIDGPIARFFFYCACLVLLEGVTVNVLEGSFMAMAFGASFRFLQESPRVSASRVAAQGRRPLCRGS